MYDQSMLLILIFFPLLVLAGLQPEAFIDAYYMWDFQGSDKRAFTTQPIRHDQPAINLAHVGGSFESKYWRSRLILQAGDSVERNASLEPGKEKYLQEAFLGYRLSENTWLDAGIYLSHMGFESWISRENPTYSRSLMSDYVPYYSTGMRLEHEINADSSFQFHLMQGWQIVSETNSAKAVGIQYRWKNFTYNNFLGDEKIWPQEKTRFRHYHNFIFQKGPITAAFDLGQEGQDSWGAVAAILQQVLNEQQSISYRLEHYFDPKGVNVGTRFITQSASINFDQKLQNKILWRNELRGFLSEEKIYQDKKNWDAFVVTSLSFWY
jgi:hypothetical protein